MQSSFHPDFLDSHQKKLYSHRREDPPALLRRQRKFEILAVCCTILVIAMVVPRLLCHEALVLVSHRSRSGPVKRPVTVKLAALPGDICEGLFDSLIGVARDYKLL